MKILKEICPKAIFLVSELEKFIASVSEIVVVVVDQDHHYPIIKNLMVIYLSINQPISVNQMIKTNNEQINHA